MNHELLDISLRGHLTAGRYTLVLEAIPLGSQEAKARTLRVPR